MPQNQQGFRSATKSTFQVSRLGTGNTFYLMVINSVWEVTSSRTMLLVDINMSHNSMSTFIDISKWLTCGDERLYVSYILLLYHRLWIGKALCWDKGCRLPCLRSRSWPLNWWVGDLRCWSKASRPVNLRLQSLHSKIWVWVEERRCWSKASRLLNWRLQDVHLDGWVAELRCWFNASRSLKLRLQSLHS